MAAPEDVAAAARAGARDTLMRALERLDDAERQGGYPEAVIVTFAVRFPDGEHPDGGPLISDGVGYETSGIPAWQAEGLLLQVARRIEGP